MIDNFVRGLKMALPSTNFKFTSKIVIFLLVSLKLLVSAEYQPGWKPPRISNFQNYKIRNHHVLLKEGADNQFNLVCDVEDGAEPEPVIEWLKNGEVILKDSIQGIVISDEKIDFIEPSIELHEGYYQCTAKNPIGLAKSEIILVSAIAPEISAEWTPPVFTEGGKPKVALPIVGQTVEFQCDASGVPRPSVNWTFNGNFLSDKETLTISDISPDDVGTYACNTSNLAGYEYQEVYLNILTTPPNFLERPKKEQTVSIGMTAYLRCNAHGYPKPTIQWFFEGNEIYNDSDYTISERGDLTIKKVQAQNEGSYECRASNDFGSPSVNALLKVVSGTKIIAGPIDLEAKVQSTIRMNCSVVWDPATELEVSWKKDNVDMQIDGERITSDQDTHFLTIRDLNFADAGAYTCVAIAGNDIATDTGTLRVSGIPAELVSGHGPHDLTTGEGSPIEIMCKVIGLPLPKHIWYKWENPNNGATSKRVSVDDKIKIDPESGTLRIENAEIKDSGKYICRAENGYGEPVVRSAIIDVRKNSILHSPEYQSTVLKSGEDVLFDCHVETDPKWKAGELKVNWLKGQQQLNLTRLLEDQSIDNLEENQRFVLLSNQTLQIRDPKVEDVGDYKCEVKTGIDEVVLIARLSMKPSEEWILILIIIIVCILILLILIICIVCVRKRARRKGRYGVKDVTDGKCKNRSDIQYSIDDEEEGLHKGDDGDNTTTTPIIKPNGNNKRSSPLASNGDLKGSENSLLNMTDEDLWLRKGMDEDGSFRQVYIQE